MKPVRKYWSGGQDTCGQTLPMTVMFLPLVILFVGLCIDLGFAYITKAQLSKGVDAAALAAMSDISQGTVTAQSIGSATFAANYNGNSAKNRDVGTVVPQFTWTVNSTNITVDVTANTIINTFLIRLLTPWKTMSVGATSEATRNRLVLSLVLDRSGSMLGNGGSGALPGAATDFIDLFNDAYDQAAMISYSSTATTPADVTMRQPFKTDIQNGINAISFGGWTASEQGLTNALAQNNTVASGPDVFKVIVFFTDGMANTWNYTFDCGNRNIAPDDTLYDPATGNLDNNGCTIPNSIPSFNGGSLDPTVCANMNEEAEARAQRVASLARAAGNIIFSVGMGSPGQNGECNNAFPVLNPDFLKNVANTPDSETYDPTQPVGDYVIAADSGSLDQAFREIATKILLRLSK